VAPITFNTGLRTKYRRWCAERPFPRDLKRARSQAIHDATPEANRALLASRHRYAAWLADGNSKPLAEMAQPDLPDLRVNEYGLAEISGGELTAGVLRKAILDYGALLVRGMVDPQRAESYSAGIDQAYESRSSSNGGGAYEPFVPDPPYVPLDEFRPWIEESGGLLAVDCPGLHAEMLEFIEESGLKGVADEYLGGPAVISAHKTTLRKVEPGTKPGWHQDGAFMGEVRSLNLWLALSRCGDEAPGMDVLPARLDEFVATGGEGTSVANQVSQADAEAAAAAAGVSIVRPIFNPGDALIFDEMFLHATAADGPMTKPRYAIESWFFTPAALPPGYVPIAL
jgi:hypothetical protein